MISNSVLTPLESSSQIRWLTRLRWSAFVIQAGVLFIAYNFLQLSLPYTQLLITLGILAASNFLLVFWSYNRINTSRFQIGSILAFDTLLLTVLLYLSGGPANPFSIVYISQVCIAAILLGSKWTWFMVLLSSVCFSVLFQFHIAVPELESHHHGGEAFSAHLLGMLVAFVLVSVLLGFFLAKMSETVRLQAEKITQLKSQQEKLTSLTTLSAGAAHELGTPLSTITLAATELKRVLESESVSQSVRDDISLIFEETQKCRSIINKMASSSGSLSGEMLEKVPLTEVADSVISEIGKDCQHMVKFDIQAQATCFAPPKSLKQTIIALVKNALDPSNNAKNVIVSAQANNQWTSFSIQDDGAGMSKDILSRLGEPFFTTKDPGKGMGLGIFLAKLFASSMEGKLEFSSTLGKGTSVLLRFPSRIL